MDRDESELVGIFKKWIEAILSHDMGFFERVLDDGWIYTDIVGVLRNKQQYLDRVHDLPPEIKMRFVDAKTRVLGDFAIMNGSYVVEGSLADGTDVTSFSRFTGVWRRSSGGWRSLAHHATTIAAPGDAG